jgi:hypothetical protein
MEIIKTLTEKEAIKWHVIPPHEKDLQNHLNFLKKSKNKSMEMQYKAIEDILQRESVKADSVQFYKMADTDSMPVGNYIYVKTGKLIERLYTCANPHYQIATPIIISYAETNGYSAVWSRVEPQRGYTSFHTIFEKITEGEIVLISIAYEQVKGKVDKKSMPEINVYGASLTSDNLTVEYDKFIEVINKNIKTKRIQSNNISLVISTMRGYDTTPFELPKQKINIPLNYGKGFEPIHKKIITELNRPNGKGLVLLHGLPGTGKTHYLKHIASSIKNKKVLFIPPHMADFITSPEMTGFLIDNANSVLFIEDAERVITDRSVNGSTGVSNILNITDGILSDILNIQVVATFNMDKRKIDSALLRKGRLIAEHKFDALPKEDAQALLTHLGYDAVATGPMTLTEIYNVNDVEYKSEEPTAIGFR